MSNQRLKEAVDFFTNLPNFVISKNPNLSNTNEYTDFLHFCDNSLAILTKIKDLIDEYPIIIDNLPIQSRLNSMLPGMQKSLEASILQNIGNKNYFDNMLQNLNIFKYDTERIYRDNIIISELTTLRETVIKIKDAEKTISETGQSINTVNADLKKIAGTVSIGAMAENYKKSAIFSTRLGWLYEFIILILFAILIIFVFSPFIDNQQINWIRLKNPSEIMWINITTKYSVIFTLLFIISYLIYQVNKNRKSARYYKQLELQITLLATYTERINQQENPEQQEFLREIGKNYFKGLPPLDVDKDSFKGIPYQELLYIIQNLSKKA